MASSYFSRVCDRVSQLLNADNTLNSETSYLEESVSGDEELLDITRTQLDLMDDTEDFCLCRRCRHITGPTQCANNLQPLASATYFTNTTVIPHNSEENGVVPNNCNNVVNGTGECSSLLYDSSEDEHVESMHCHVKPKALFSTKMAQKQLIASSLTCLTFMTAEIIGGYLSNSLAIMSDAAHLCADLAGFVISIFAVWIAQKSPTKRMSFGFYRAEILGAMVSVVFIWILTGILVYTAVERIYHDDYDIDADIMLIVSGTGVVMNIIMGLILHGWCPIGSSHGHSHGLRSSHGHSHGESSNINIRAALIHVLGDLLQSIGVLISAYIIKYKPEYKIADPICTFLFSALVLFTTISILKDAILILMEGFPRDLTYTSVKTALQSIKGVRMIHSLHVWSLTLDRNALAVHLAVDEDADQTVVLQAAQCMVRKRFGIFSSTIQVEKYAASEMLSCETCKGP